MEGLLAIAFFGGGFLVFMMGLTVRIVAGAWRPRSSGRALPSPSERALAILNERYATGEIGRDEYLERRAFIE